MSTLRNDAKDVGGKLSWLVALVGLPALSVNAIVNAILDPYRQLYDIVVLTAPLLVSTTLIALMVVRMKGGGNIFLVFSAIIFPYVAAVVLGVADAASAPPIWRDDWQDYTPWGPFMATATGIVTFYLSAFGLQRTVAGIACGVFVAWVIHTKILPRLEAQKAATPPPEAPPPEA